MRRRVIYYGTTNESWVQCKLYDLRKAFGWGASGRFWPTPCSSALPQPPKNRFRDARGDGHRCVAGCIPPARSTRSSATVAALMNSRRSTSRRTSSIRSSACARSRSAKRTCSSAGTDKATSSSTARPQALLAVVGVSGSGKSSLVRAGLFPASAAASWPRRARIGGSPVCAGQCADCGASPRRCTGRCATRKTPAMMRCRSR